MCELSLANLVSFDGSWGRGEEREKGEETAISGDAFREVGPRDGNGGTPGGVQDKEAPTTGGTSWRHQARDCRQQNAPPSLLTYSWPHMGIHGP